MGVCIAQGRKSCLKGLVVDFRGRVTPSVSLSGEHIALHRMISCLQVHSVSQPPNTMLSMGRSVCTHDQPSAAKHTQEFLTHLEWETIYNSMLFPWTKPSNLCNNVQGEQEIIKHGKVHKVEKNAWKKNVWFLCIWFEIIPERKRPNWKPEWLFRCPWSATACCASAGPNEQYRPFI